MKKLLILLSLVCIRQVNAQTWVTIPDANFINYLQSVIPGAMNGNQLNTSSTLVTTSTQTINVSTRGIADLTGIQYFTSLTLLYCDNNSLTSLPPLSNSLITLGCGNNSLTILPTLPNSLTTLGCGGNSLTNLPILPASLTLLACNGNSLTSLPTLPLSLDTLWCYNNSLTSLPTLPNSLRILYCQNNSLTSLPALPNSLTILWCNNNSLTSVPTLPDSLQALWCNNNSLTSLPILPNSLIELYCQNNNITCFPTFPNSILPAVYAPQPHMWLYYIRINNNPFTCLPNYLSSAMDSTTLSFPLCTVGNPNGCAVGVDKINIINNRISVYPNPTSDQFFIDTNTTDKLNMDLYNVNGRHVFSKSVSDKENINVATLDNGIYTLTIKTADRVINKKLVIVH